MSAKIASCSHPSQKATSAGRIEIFGSRKVVIGG
jgi:hypothetical protein